MCFGLIPAGTESSLISCLELSVPEPSCWLSVVHRCDFKVVPQLLSWERDMLALFTALLFL